MAKKPKAGSAAKPPPVRVRMYRQGLGDCFLLTFGAGAGRRHMLIDCGTLGKKATTVTLEDVADDILQESGGELDLVVATHEHHDHVSGFREKLFQGITARRAWLAWTEDPKDPDAKRLAIFQQDIGQALAAAARASPKGDRAGLAIKGLLGFFDPDAGGNLGAAEFASTVHKAMEFVRTKMGADVTYLEPGDGPIEDFAPGFRFYVLGPPRDETALGTLGAHGSEHLYGLWAAATRRAAQAGDGGGVLTDAECEAEMPFDARFRSGDRGQARGWYPAYYDDPTQQWRDIETDWLRAAADLALQLDNLTNNTSLALAVERVADGKVLLFPADAQEGSWLSWHDDGLTWTVADAAGLKKKVTAADLLRRTVFLKVGHHASHNATARAKGLELMKQNRNELTAFIPVDREIALGRNPQGSWKMPARPLYRRLLELCEGRVARSDLGWADDATAAENPDVEKEFEDLATPEEWNDWRASQLAAKRAKKVQVHPNFIDYTLK